jgi:hypothetical protein
VRQNFSIPIAFLRDTSWPPRVSPYITWSSVSHKYYLNVNTAGIFLEVVETYGINLKGWVRAVFEILRLSTSAAHCNFTPETAKIFHEFSLLWRHSYFKINLFKATKTKLLIQFEPKIHFLIDIICYFSIKCPTFINCSSKILIWYNKYKWRHHRFTLYSNSSCFPTLFYLPWKTGAQQLPFSTFVSWWVDGYFFKFLEIFEILRKMFDFSTFLIVPTFYHLFRLSTSGTTRTARSTGPSRSPRTSTWACSSR